MRNKDIERIVYAAMFIAIVFVATYFIQIPTPGSMGGLVHVGTVALFAIALKYGKYYGALAGGLGMALFDILSLWLVWAPGTFIVRLVMGYSVGLLSQDSKGQGQNFLKNIVAICVGAAIMIPGYFIFEAYILGAGVGAAMKSIPGNITQNVLGLVALAIVLYLPNMKTNEK